MAGVFREEDRVSSFIVHTGRRGTSRLRVGVRAILKGRDGGPRPQSEAHREQADARMMDTCDQGATRGSPSPSSQRAEEKAQAAQTGSRKACGRRGEVGAVAMASVYQTQEPSRVGAPGGDSHPTHMEWGGGSEHRGHRRHPCKGAPRRILRRGQVRGLPQRGKRGEQLRRPWRASGEVGSSKLEGREADSRKPFRRRNALGTEGKTGAREPHSSESWRERAGGGSSRGQSPGGRRGLGRWRGGCGRTKTSGCLRGAGPGRPKLPWAPLQLWVFRGDWKEKWGGGGRRR